MMNEECRNQDGGWREGGEDGAAGAEQEIVAAVALAAGHESEAAAGLRPGLAFLEDAAIERAIGLGHGFDRVADGAELRGAFARRGGREGVGHGAVRGGGAAGLAVAAQDGEAGPFGELDDAGRFVGPAAMITRDHIDRAIVHALGERVVAE
ncbi:MAG: hypothetical protein ACREIA_26940 [Opitutaceae bacterium]